MTPRPDELPPDRHPAIVNIALAALGLALGGGLLWLIGHVGGAGP